MNWHLRVAVAVSLATSLASAAGAGQASRPPRPAAGPVAAEPGSPPRGLGAVGRKTAPGVDAPEVDGTTALHRAAWANDAAAVRRLLKAGASMDAVNRYGVSALSLAASNGNADVLAQLLAAGADLQRADRVLPDGQTVLMLAARTGSEPSMRLLVEHGAQVDARETRTGTTALVWAVIDDRADAVRALIKAGASVNALSRPDSYPHSPMKVTDTILEPGVSYAGQTVLAKGSWTPLMYAARQGSLDAARVLVEAGAELNATDPDGTTPLMFTVINGHYDLAGFLADKGADVNLPDRTGMTPLYAAVDMRNMPPPFGRPNPTPIVVAASLDAMRMLLAHGANPNVGLKTPILKRGYNAGDRQLGEGATPVMRAARSGDLAAMRMLVEHGADAKLAQKNGTTALMLAAGIRARADEGGAPTPEAARAVEAVGFLLAQGADINGVNAAGETAAHAAIRNVPVLQLLASRGASLTVKNKQGRTPLEAALAATPPSTETVALLRQLTAETGRSSAP
jgi:ankyrin